MAFVYYVVLALHVIACLFLIAVVLLQQGKGQDLASAFGGGGTQAAFGPRGSATVLSRATTILAGLFMVTSLSLSDASRPHRSRVLDQVPRLPPRPRPPRRRRRHPRPPRSGHRRRPPTPRPRTARPRPRPAPATKWRRRPARRRPTAASARPATAASPARRTP